MGEQKNTITINGKVYDSRSGSPLNANNSHSKHKVKIIDSVYPSSSVKNVSYPRAHKIAVSQETSKTNEVSTRKHSKQQQAHRTPQHAKTLMRSAVSKPAFASPGKVSGLVVDKKSLNSAVREASIQQKISEERVKRAQDVSRSHLVSRFGTSAISVGVVKKHANLSVKEAPEEEISTHHEKPIIESLAEPMKTAEALFADALSNATSHNQPSVKQKRKDKKLGMKRSTANVLALVAVFFMISGFVAYQNASNVAVKVASAKAGIHGILPGYKPSGFALSRNVQASPGQIVLSFSSTSDNRNFSITQAASNWNSETLLDSFVVATGQPYQRVNSSNGKTIYTYGDANATWVDGGIWYKLEGDSALSSQQILQIANSL